MWQDLISQVDVIWMVLVLVTTAGLLALAIAYFFLMRAQIRSHLTQYHQFNDQLTTLHGCQISHLLPVKEQVRKRMNPEFVVAFDRLVTDSTAMYRDVWIPDPSSRLPFEKVWPKKLRQLFDQPIQSAVLLGGIAVTTLTWSTGLALYGESFNLIGLRLIAFTPILVCALIFLWIRQMREIWLYQLREQWQQTMITLERHLPVFNQAAETAMLLHEIKDYDLRMADSAREMTDQVRRLASGQLTESISNAVKYVMSANIAPSIMKSSDALSLLAREIENRLKDSELMLGRMCTELETRQQQQADLWLKRYQELSASLEHHQTDYFDQMKTTINQLSLNISQTQEQLLGNLTRTQTEQLKELVNQQQEIIEQVNTDSHQVWQVLQDQLSGTLTGLTEGQNQLISQIRQTDEAQAAALSQRHELAMGQISQQLELLTGRLATTQNEVWQAMREHQEQIAQTLLDQQEQVTQNLLGQQEQVAQTLLSQQGSALEDLSRQQSDAYSKATELQRQGLETLSERHEALIGRLDQHQNEAITAIDQRQSASVDAFRQHQEEIFKTMAQRQQTALDQLADRFAGEVSQTLSDQLDPVSTRLQQSAEILVAAQSYAESVRETLHSQHEQSSALQETIRDLYQQLKDTHQGLNTDLSALRQSSGTMSEAAETMSQIYAGSQSGLSQSIERMSGDMSLLSETLQSIMAGSAEQTQMMQSQSNEIYETNQKHLEAVREQIEHLSNELATRIDQLMIGFGNMTEQLMQQVTGVVNEQNETLGGNLRSLSETMGDEARSMSLFAQQINMEIEELSSTLGQSVSEFDSGIRDELSSVLSQFDKEVTEVVKRLARVATELGDAVESLPEAIRHIQK